MKLLFWNEKPLKLFASTNHSLCSGSAPSSRPPPLQSNAFVLQFPKQKKKKKKRVSRASTFISTETPIHEVWDTKWMNRSYILQSTSQSQLASDSLEFKATSLTRWVITISSRHKPRVILMWQRKNCRTAENPVWYLMGGFTLSSVGTSIFYLGEDHITRLEGKHWFKPFGLTCPSY